MTKLLQKISNNKFIVVACVMSVVLCMSAIAFADSGDNAFSATTLQPIVTALQGAITVTDIVNLFTSGVVIALPLILVWFGARWVCNYEMLIENVVNAS